MRVCAHPGCPELVPRGESYCAAHKPERKRARDERPSAARRGYGHEWRQIRKAYLQENPACEWCGAKAIVVDHIVPLSDGGTHDRSNLRALCLRCHNKRHKSGRKRRVGGI